MNHFSPDGAEQKRHLVVVGGPTASGKTAFSIEIAQRFQTAILSADSRQFYREMNIGTAKPVAAELAAAPHHFINSLSVEDDYSVGNFERDATALLGQLFGQHQVVVVAGGSGLFINALCNGLDAFPEVSPEIRHYIAEQEKKHGLAWLQTQLEQRDAVYFRQADQSNPARLRRALEVTLSAGAPYSSFLTVPKVQRPWTTHYWQMDWPRDVLYERINQRVDQMLEQGLEAEARALLPFRNRPALRTVGYEEWFDYFDGKTDRDTAIDKIKQHSRNYAKRQLTWFRKYGHWQMVQWEDRKLFLDALAQHISE